MANAPTQTTPDSKLWRDQIIPRILDGQRADQRGKLKGVLENIASTFDTAAQSFDKKMRSQPWTQAGREYAASEAITEATAMLKVFADSATQHHREHMAALDAELSQVPSINEFRAVEIRDLIRDMTRSERDAFVAQNDDPEVLSAILHGPKSFPIASTDSVQRALTNFNRAHRADRVALRDDAAAYVSAVENFADMVARELRRVLR